MALSRDADFMFPALGAGKLDEDINQLIEAPEVEEDFDVLNDETFGDIGDADYDWEDEHNRMAVELESSSFFDSGPGQNQTTDSGFVTMDRGYTSLAQEDEMERSVRRLVVDDDTKGFTPFGEPIPGAQRRSHLDELFGPNSPPGYMDMETLTSPEKNIWGSPSLDSPAQKSVNNTLQALFASAKQAAIRDFPGMFQDQRASPMHGPALPAEVPTLAEIEHNMMAREQQKPKVLTAAELERQLRGEPPLPSDSKPAFSMPAPIPTMGTAVAFRKQPTQVPPGMGPMPTTMAAGAETAPINIVRPPAHGLPGFPEPPSVAALGRSPSPSHVPPGVPPPMMAQSPRLMSPYNPAAVLMANRIFGSPMMRPSPPTHVPPPPLASPYGSPSANVMGPRGPHGPMLLEQQSPPRPRMTYPSGNMYSGQHAMPPPPPQPQAGRGVHPGQRSSSGAYGHGHQYFDRRDQHYHQRGGYHGHAHNRHELSTSDFPDREAEDEYAGLMTKKEKDWIIKIQLIQLQTDNPYLDDYYYTYNTLKKKAAEREKLNQNGSADSKNNEPELLIPSMMKIEPRVYTPAQFEGSLGRLTAASVHNPRQIIDVCRNVSPTNEESGQKNVSKELRRYRQLLMDIEKGFNMILDVDDIEKKVLALPDENRLPLFEERLEKIKNVYDYFMQDESLKNFLPAMGVRKGRKLLARLLPLLDKIQQLSIVTVLLSHLRELIKKDQGEEGLAVLNSPLSRYISKCDLEFLVHFAAILQKHPQQNEEGISLLLKHAFGVNLLCNLIKAGDNYFSNTSVVDIDNQLKTQWIQFLEEFVESLQDTPKAEIAWPATPHPIVSQHIDRFINNKMIGAVEDKLAHLSKPRLAQTEGSSEVTIPVS